MSVLGILLLWPIFVFGQPAYFSDSLSYLRGGRYAVAYATAKVEKLTSHGSAVQSGQAQAAQPAPTVEARGARSISYSVLAAILSWPQNSMLALAVLQALWTALLLEIARHHIMGCAGSRGFLSIVGLVFVTPLAVFTCLAMPDIFAGIALLAILVLMLDGKSNAAAKFIAVMSLGAGVAFHASHVPLAIGTGMVAVALHPLIYPHAIARTLRVALLLGIAVLGGVGATLFTNWVGFGEAGLTTKRFPLTLARSIEDGPARWYLEQECKKPSFAICEVYGTRFPATVTTFLWGPTGITTRATPAQLDRIRAEEEKIVLAAARRYPNEQATNLLGNFASQIASFSTIDAHFSWRPMQSPEGFYFEQRKDAAAQITTKIDRAAVVVALAALLYLIVSFAHCTREEKAICVLVVFGLLLNAGICSVLSGVANRYQARVIWLLPFIALMLWHRKRARASGEKSGGP